MKGKSIENKKIVVVGLSRSGFSAALLAKKKKAKVFVSEIVDNKQMRQRAELLKKKGIFVELGLHSDEFFHKSQFLVISPGLKPHAYPLVWAKRHRVDVFSEVEFASWFCQAPVIAITGSNGKTTTTSLLGKIFKNSGKKTIICGNIGNPFSSEYNKFKTADIVVLEVSSFQLEHIKYFKPNVAVVLNITQNHFDHHKDMKAYIKAKSNIFFNQCRSDVSILNISDSRVMKLKGKTKAKIRFFAKNRKDFALHGEDLNSSCWLEKDDIFLKQGNRLEKIFNKNELRIKGIHNIENAMAAFLGAKAMGLSQYAILNTIKSFSGLEHRSQVIAKRKGIVFVNDSKSTTVDATMKALSIFPDRSVFLICGGRDKGSNFKIIRPLIKRKVRSVIVIGEASEKITKVFNKYTQVIKVKDLEKAVMLAYRKARKKETVLLSPMCSSFDMFDNFEHRGRIFKQIVNRIRE